MGTLTGPGLGKFTCGDLSTCSLSDLGTVDAGDITSGTFGLARIPIMDDAHIPDLETLSYGGTFAEAQIPDLPTTKITEGTFGVARIPILPTDRYGSAVLVSGTRFMEGTFNTGNHPIDDVSKMGFRDIHDAALITDGTYLVSITNKAESLWGNLALGWLYPRSIYSYGTLNMNYHPIKDPHMDLYGSFAPSKYRGLYISDQTAGTAVAFGDLAYFKSDGKWWDTDADAESTTKGELGMVLETIATNGTGKILKLGYTKNTSWSFGVGSVVYVSCAPGSITTTPPSASGDQVRKVGVAHTGNILYFNPDDTIIEIA